MTAEPQNTPKKSKKLPRPSVLPLLMGALALLISVRVGHVVQDFSVSVGSRSEAQAQTPAATPAPAATNAAATPAAATDAHAATPAEATSEGAVSPDTNLAAKTPTDPLDYTDEEVDVLQQLAKRREELDQRATQLDEREA